VKYLFWIVHISIIGLSVCAASCTSDTGIKMVKVKGHLMRAQTAGMSHGNAGQPTVVFEAGAGESFATWNSVVPAVAEFARTIAYERSGNGESEWDGQQPTSKHVAENLHLLLQQLGAAPPYVLVGHSLGGWYIRMYTGFYPEEVAGLVYVDGGLLPSEKDLLALYKALGAPAEDLTVHTERYRKNVADIIAQASPGASRAELQVSDPCGVDVQALPYEVPIAALMAAKIESSKQEWYRFFPCEPEECRARELSVTMGWFSRLGLTVPDGTFIVDRKSGHYIQNDNPELVISAIRRVVSSARKRR
jgi:pimeloyl-ACP methyl ester carboxylesterase